MQYVQDYDEKYGMAEYGDGNSSPQVQWYLAVQPYMKSGTQYGKGGVFQCPSYIGQYNEDAQSYGVHSALWTSFYGPPNSSAVTKSSTLVQSPSDKVMVAEKGANGAGYSYPVFSSWEVMWTSGVGDPRGSKDDNNLINNTDCDAKPSDPNPTRYECAAMPRYRHLGTSNFLFADGHVKAIVRGRIQWFTNIYVATGGYEGDVYDYNQYTGEKEGWYPWPN